MFEQVSLSFPTESAAKLNRKQSEFEEKRIVTFACYGFVSLVNEWPGTVYKNENRVDSCGERDAGPDEHLRNHLHHLLQTHELYLV